VIGGVGMVVSWLSTYVLVPILTRYLGAGMASRTRAGARAALRSHRARTPAPGARRRVGLRAAVPARHRNALWHLARDRFFEAPACRLLGEWRTLLGQAHGSDAAAILDAHGDPIGVKRAGRADHGPSHRARRAWRSGRVDCQRAIGFGRAATVARAVYRGGAEVAIRPDPHDARTSRAGGSRASRLCCQMPRCGR
jgi:hypothetical protein